MVVSAVVMNTGLTPRPIPIPAVTDAQGRVYAPLGVNQGSPEQAAQALNPNSMRLVSLTFRFDIPNDANPELYRLTVPGASLAVVSDAVVATAPSSVAAPDAALQTFGRVRERLMAMTNEAVLSATLKAYDPYGKLTGMALSGETAAQRAAAEISSTVDRAR
jgi:hypothetical protein